MSEVRQDADGRPYVAFYDPETHYGFCWAGDPSEPVEVCHGGMGEPVFATFLLPYDIQRAGSNAVRRTLLAFQRVCEAWMREQRRNVSGHYVLFYTSADGPGNDATWSVYREEYVNRDAAEPIEGSQRHISTHPNEAEAEAEARRLQQEMVLLQHLHDEEEQ